MGGPHLQARGKNGPTRNSKTEEKRIRTVDHGSTIGSVTRIKTSSSADRRDKKKVWVGREGGKPPKYCRRKERTTPRLPERDGGRIRSLLLGIDKEIKGMNEALWNNSVVTRQKETPLRSQAHH